MFSELIDDCVHIAGRPDSLMEFVKHANETMRDMSKRRDWPDDLVEELYEPDFNETPWTWEPSAGRARFRRETFIEDGCGCELAATVPSRRQQRIGRFYYRSGITFVFKTDCAPIKIAYYAYQPWLKYYPAGTRPSVFDVETGEFTDPAALDLVSNWILERHNEIVQKGTLARFFASKSDPRQQVHYSAYEQGISHIVRGEDVGQLLGARNG